MTTINYLERTCRLSSTALLLAWLVGPISHASGEIGPPEADKRAQAPTPDRGALRPIFSNARIDDLLTGRLHRTLRRLQIGTIQFKRLSEGGFTYVVKRSNLQPFYGSAGRVEGLCWAARCPTPIPSNGVLLVSAQGIRFQATRDIQQISGAPTRSEETLMYDAGLAAASEAISAMKAIR